MYAKEYRVLNTFIDNYGLYGILNALADLTSEKAHTIKNIKSKKTYARSAKLLRDTSQTLYDMLVPLSER